MRTLVIGIGNLLRTDDGVGIHIIRNLNNFVPRIDILDAAMGGVEILEAMRGYDQVIIVDAIESGAEPGTIFRVNLTEGEKPPVVSHSHGIDLITTLNLGRQLYGEEIPAEIILFAVEAEDTTTINDVPTLKVRAAIQETIKAILAITGLSQ